MMLPFVSPYLHSGYVPARNERGRELCFTHCIGGRTDRISSDEVALLSVLWPRPHERHTPNDAPAALRALSDEIGAEPLSRAFHRLFDRGFLFNDPTACEGALLSAIESKLSRIPFIDQVELTNHCPMHCRFCPRGVPGALQRPKGRMSLDLFRALLVQLPERQRDHHPLELDLMGESLQHPEVDRFVEAASLAGIPSELSVNPSLLTPELSRRLLSAGISRLVLSLDGMDNPVLMAIRGKAANYDQAAFNILTLIALAARRSSPPSVIVQMLDLAANHHHHDDFLRTWNAALGREFVTAYIKPLDGPDPDTGQPHVTSPRFLCIYPFVSVSVLWDGSVVPCCRDADGRYILGNLNENSLEAIWNGPKAEQLRSAYRHDRFAPGHLCEGCPWRRSHYAAALWERHPQRAVFEPMHW